MVGNSSHSGIWIACGGPNPAQVKWNPHIGRHALRLGHFTLVDELLVLPVLPTGAGMTAISAISHRLGRRSPRGCIGRGFPWLRLPPRVRCTRWHGEWLGGSQHLGSLAILVKKGRTKPFQTILYTAVSKDFVAFSAPLLASVSMRKRTNNAVSLAVPFKEVSGRRLDRSASHDEFFGGRIGKQSECINRNVRKACRIGQIKASSLPQGRAEQPHNHERWT